MANEQKHQKQKELLASFQNWWAKRALFTKIVIAIVAIAVPIIYLAVVWFYFKDPELAKASAALFAGALLLLQVSISNRRATAIEKTADIAEKGNTAERFKTAIEHLGNTSPSIRLGGIYSLHRLAKDQLEYRQGVFEILCAHVRQITADKNNYVPLARVHKREKWMRPYAGSMGGKIVDEESQQVERYKIEEPSTEIRTILDLLLVKRAECQIYQEFKADLAGANLRGAMLYDIDTHRKGEGSGGINLRRADLSHADLRDTHIHHADLRGAFLHYANLEDAVLQCANLSGVFFNHAEMRNADLSYADLQGTNFGRAYMRDAGIWGCKNLDPENLAHAATLYHAGLPPEVEGEIRRKNPELLRKLKDEKDD